MIQTRAQPKKLRLVAQKFYNLTIAFKHISHQAHSPQRKVASTGAQNTREYKGHSKQVITMAFLEEGGYFDVPIQVNVILFSQTL